MIIYKIVNNINGKIYIGQTKHSLSKRIAGHIKDNSTPVQKALNKYGLESFTIFVIDHADSKAVIDEKERYWIRVLKSNQRAYGYNMTAGGDGLVNPSKKVRSKISNTLKEHYKTHEHTSGFSGHSHKESSKKKMSETLKVTMNLPEVKAKMSASAPKTKSEEHKRKIGDANRGNKRPDLVEYNRTHDRTGKNNTMYGKKRPDLAELNRSRAGEPCIFSDPEGRARKISESRTGKKYPETLYYADGV